MQHQNNDEKLVSQFQRLGLFKDNDIVQALVTKMVPPNNNANGSGGSLKENIPDQASMERISKMLATDIDDAANMMQILPDLGLAKEIMVSLIIAPKDLLTHKLIWGTGKCDLSSQLVGEFTEYLSNYFDQSYKINDLLIPMCEDALFNTGSYPLVIIPESSLDDIINQNGRISIESLQDEKLFQNGHITNKGILGPGLSVVADGDKGYKLDASAAKVGFGMESLASRDAMTVNATPWFDSNIRILDSADNLKIPLLQERMTQEMLRDRLNYGNVSLESVDRDEELERLEKSMFVRRPSRHVPVITVDVKGNSSRLPKGHPLVMRMPSESIIPVHTPGSPTDHLGYFVMIDEFGNPVTRATSQDYYKQMTNNMRTPMDNYNSQASTMLANVKTFMGPNCQADKYDGMQLLNAYAGMAKYEFLTRLKRSLYGENVEMSDIADKLYPVMFARSLAGMHTSMLYVPVEQCTYVAFDYNNAGLGKSLLSDVKILGALRSTLLFSDTMISLRNAVPHRKVTIGLDETDPDPYKTIALLQGEFAKTLNYAFPLGVTDPKEQIDMLQKAGVQWEITGHPQYPTTSLTVDNLNIAHARIEPELSENIKNMMFMGIGIPPEIVDSSLNIEFAASVYSSNLLLAKRSAQKQEILTGFMVDLVRKYVLSDGILLAGLTEIIDRHKEDLLAIKEEGRDLHYSTVISMYLDALKMTLPAADQTRVEAQLKAVQDQLSLYEAIIPTIINDGVLREMLGSEYGELADPVIQAIKSNLMLDWMVAENIAPEVQKLVRKVDEDNPGYDFLTARLDHLAALSVTLASYIKKIANKNGGEDDSAGGTGGGSDYSDDTGGDTGGDDGLGFDFGGGDDSTTEATDSPETTDANPESDTPAPEEDEQTPTDTGLGF